MCDISKAKFGQRPRDKTEFSRVSTSYTTVRNEYRAVDTYMTMEKQALLEPYQLGPIKLTSRVVMAPLTRTRADNEEHVPTDLHVEYYRQRSSSGLIISEGTQVNPQGVGVHNTPGIYTDAQVDAWKKVTDAVHEAGGHIYCQLWHEGRLSHPEFHGGDLPVAPSAINPNVKIRISSGSVDTVTPRALTVEEINQTVQDYQKAAANAIAAGFDGVEVHASNGYLLHQFFVGSSNQRTDEYGGSIENRARILFDVLDAIGAVVDFERVGVRMNPDAHGLFGMEIDEQTAPTFDYIVQRLNDYGLAYIHLSEPFTPVDDVPFAIKTVAKHFRPMYSGTLMTNSAYTQESGNSIIDAGYADLVAFGKLFIANPDLVERFAANAALNEPDPSTFYGSGPKGYTDYPFMHQPQEA